MPAFAQSPTDPQIAAIVVTANSVDIDAGRLLNGLGAEIEIERTEESATLRGLSTCPLSAAVARRPELFGTLASLLSEYLGTEARDRCDRGERSHCRFEVSLAGQARQSLH